METTIWGLGFRVDCGKPPATHLEYDPIVVTCELYGTKFPLFHVTTTLSLGVSAVQILRTICAHE